MDTRTEIRESLRGGNGCVIFNHILGDKEMKTNARLFAEMILEPGCSVGYHQHNGESETYYILSGTGTYDDNGTVRTVKAGDVTFTPDGSGHGIANDGTEDLKFIALILLDK